jgi:phosphoribosylanthranilate isomerase
VKVKICGLTRPEDAARAAGAGATGVGVVLSSVGPRALGLAEAARVLSVVPDGVDRVGVFVSPEPRELARASEELGLTHVQVHGRMPERRPAAVGLIRAYAPERTSALRAIAPAPEETVLLDSAGPGGRGGTGARLDWAMIGAAAPPWPFVLAGGLTDDNVVEAIAVARPHGVDVSSGVEVAPGVKDPDRLERFVHRARAAVVAA